jgi:hypothetical protein
MALADSGDRERRRESFARTKVFAHLGAEPELDATRDQLRELGARPPTRARGAGVAGHGP